MDPIREQRIIFQNSMGHATNIVLHNSQGKPVDVKEIIALAKKIAIVALTPQLEKVAEDLRREKST